LILIYSLLLNDFGPGGEVVKGEKGAESLHKGERSLRGEFDRPEMRDKVNDFGASPFWTTYSRTVFFRLYLRLVSTYLVSRLIW
jgi:hypothetical protein